MIKELQDLLKKHSKAIQIINDLVCIRDDKQGHLNDEFYTIITGDKADRLDGPKQGSLF